MVTVQSYNVDTAQHSPLKPIPSMSRLWLCQGHAGKVADQRSRHARQLLPTAASHFLLAECLPRPQSFAYKCCTTTLYIPYRVVCVLSLSRRTLACPSGPCFLPTRGARFDRQAAAASAWLAFASVAATSAVASHSDTCTVKKARAFC